MPHNWARGTTEVPALDYSAVLVGRDNGLSEAADGTMHPTEKLHKRKWLSRNLDMAPTVSKVQTVSGTSSFALEATNTTAKVKDVLDITTLADNTNGSERAKCCVQNTG